MQAIVTNMFVFILVLSFEPVVSSREQLELMACYFYPLIVVIMYENIAQTDEWD